MLVRLEDTKGRAHFINAVYVKSVQPKGMGDCALEISGRSTKLRVRIPAEQVVDMLNAAMPTGLDSILAAEDQLNADRAAAAAAAAG